MRDAIAHGSRASTPTVLIESTDMTPTMIAEESECWGAGYTAARLRPLLARSLSATSLIGGKHEDAALAGAPLTTQPVPTPRKLPSRNSAISASSPAQPPTSGVPRIEIFGNYIRVDPLAPASQPVPRLSSCPVADSAASEARNGL